MTTMEDVCSRLTVQVNHLRTLSRRKTVLERQLVRLEEIVDKLERDIGDVFSR